MIPAIANQLCIDFGHLEVAAHHLGGIVRPGNEFTHRACRQPDAVIIHDLEAEAGRRTTAASRGILFAEILEYGDATLGAAITLNQLEVKTALEVFLEVGHRHAPGETHGIVSIIRPFRQTVYKSQCCAHEVEHGGVEESNILPETRYAELTRQCGCAAAFERSDYGADRRVPVIERERAIQHICLTQIKDFAKAATLAIQVTVRKLHRLGNTG